MATRQQQPEWVAPVNEIEEPTLKVFNSLTRTKVRELGFVAKILIYFHIFRPLSYPKPAAS